MAITTNSDIGTFVYISRAIGVPLDTVVKWFILVVVLVFDPLSICLVLAYNFLLRKEQKELTIKVEEQQKEYKVYEDVKSVPVEHEKENQDESEQPTKIDNVVVRPWTEEPTIKESLDDDLIKKLKSDDPFPQYMTKEETEGVLERFWIKKNSSKHNHISLF